MEVLAALNESNSWNDRLTQLLRYIQTRRDLGSGLLHEFDFKGGDWSSSVVERTTSELQINWQSQNGHETVVLGHTIAGVWEGPANLAARAGRKTDVEFLLQDFVTTMHNLRGIHENGLPGNAFELIPTGSPSFQEKSWSEDSWQAELLWQFLLRAVEMGIDLAEYEVAVGQTTIAWDRMFARGLELHDATMFDGISYVGEKGPDVKQNGRQFAAPINHAAETLEALGRALVAHAGA